MPPKKPTNGNSHEPKNPAPSSHQPVSPRQNLIKLPMLNLKQAANISQQSQVATSPPATPTSKNKTTNINMINNNNNPISPSAVVAKLLQNHRISIIKKNLQQAAEASQQQHSHQQQQHMLFPPMTSSNNSTGSAFEFIFQSLRWPVVFFTIFFVFSMREFLAENIWLGLLDLMHKIAGATMALASKYLHQGDSSSSSSENDAPRLGCRTDSVGDAVALTIILFHHELTLICCVVSAFIVDTLWSFAFRKISEFVLLPSSNNSKTSSSSKTGTSVTASAMLPTPATDDGIFLTPRSISFKVVSAFPEGAQAKLIFLVILLLVFGVDIGEANMKFMALSASTKLSSQRHQQQHLASSTSMDDDEQEDEDDQQPYFGFNDSPLFATTTSSSSSSSPRQNCNNDNNNHSISRTSVARNKHLECELGHAIASPGLVIVSGPRGIGKSITTGFVVRNRAGVFCDVHRAATAEMLEETVGKCIEEHSLLSHIPQQWQSLSQAIRHLLSTWLWWNAPWFDNIAEAISVGTYWKRKRGPTFQSSSIGEAAFLVKRCDGRESDRLNDRSNNKKSPPPPHSPLIFVLDGVRDAPSVGVLGLLDISPNLLGMMQKVADIATIVIVAASDDVLNDAQHDLSHLQFINRLSNRVAFVTSSPALKDDVLPLYEAFGWSLTPPWERRKIRKQPISEAPSTSLWCHKEVMCAHELFGGAFEHVRNYANMMSPRPNVKSRGEYEMLCNAALRTVVSSAYSSTESVAGLQMGTNYHVAGESFSKNRNNANNKNSTSSSSSSMPVSSILSYRLRSLNFMLKLASAGELSESDVDEDIMEQFLKAQLVFEETVQFPMCSIETSQQHQSHSQSIALSAAPASFTVALRALAPTLLNVSLAQILIKKKDFIHEAIEILTENNDHRNNKNKWIHDFVQDLKLRIQQHKIEWWNNDADVTKLNVTCGQALKP